MLDAEQQLRHFCGADISGEERERGASAEPNLWPLQPVHRLGLAFKYLDRQGADPRHAEEAVAHHGAEPWPSVLQST